MSEVLEQNETAVKQAQEKPIVKLIPFPPGMVGEAWKWMHEFPAANFDDDGPKTLADFSAQLLASVQRGSNIIGVEHDGKTVGIVRLTRLNSRLAMFGGICFSKEVHGKGIARAALEQVIAILWLDGIEKIIAQYFADNQRVRSFLAKLGAKDEGFHRKHAKRGGKIIDVRSIAFFKPDPEVN